MVGATKDPHRSRGGLRLVLVSRRSQLKLRAVHRIKTTDLRANPLERHHALGVTRKEQWHRTFKPTTLWPRGRNSECLDSGGTEQAHRMSAEDHRATVKVHVKAILRKIQVKNRTQAAIWALNYQTASKSLHAANGEPGSKPTSLGYATS
jgi:hypothetical protein